MVVKNKVFGMLSKIEILIPVVLFLTMLITCGLYLNEKMNGTKPGLPPLPEKEKRLIMRSESGDNTDFDEDLIEPVFIGVKNDSVMVAAIPDDSARRSIEAVIYTPLFRLFSGESRKMEFSSDNERVSFIEEIKNDKEYMLISFYTDIPSSAFLPCIVSGFDFENQVDVYNIRNLFFLPDSEGNLYAIALSSEKEIYTLFPDETIPFSKINVETYDISDGWSYFEFPFYGDVTAEISTSVSMCKYQINPVSVLYGKGKDAGWVNDCFEVFSVNSNLVKSFTSGDGFEVNYVDEISELIFDDNGFVEYKALDNLGINLDDFLGYVPNEGDNYTFSDKIFAIKKIVNSIDMHNDNVSYSFSGFGQEENSNKLKVYFKLVCDGILLTDSPYDAVFEINGNNLVYAKYLSVICSKINEHYTVLPQKYADVLLRNKNEAHNVYDVYCPIMIDEDSENRIKVVKWARISSSSSEVNK